MCQVLSRLWKYRNKQDKPGPAFLETGIKCQTGVKSATKEIHRILREHPTAQNDLEGQGRGF